jgi:aldehyde:ferredoxin oxidoreductase
MSYGWMFKRAEIDLTLGTISIQREESELCRDYLGGKGSNARILWDRVPPGVSSFEDNSLLIFGTGILTGTIVPGANRAVITFKSPQNGFHMYSSVGGFWPTEVKHAGYDTLCIKGKSRKPVYIIINDDKIDICDASHVWGKTIPESRRILEKEIGEQGIQIACIGPAGENMVYGSTVETGRGASASRGGIGSVMGSKNLKGIAVRGTKDVNIAHPDRLIELCRRILGRTGPLREWLDNFAHELNRFDMLSGFFGNLNQTYFESPDEFREALKKTGKMCEGFLERQQTRELSCYNCGLNCKRTLKRPDGLYAAIKCQSWWAFMVSTKTIDYDFALKCYSICEDNGLDTVSVARYIAFAIDLFEKGILTKGDTEGLELSWGRREVVFALLEKIIHRDGIGNILADGVYKAAEHIGRGADEHAHHAKGMELFPAASCIYGPYFALALAISDKGDSTRNMSFPAQETWFRPREEKEEYINSGYFVYPKEYEKYLLAEFDRTGDNYEGSCRFAAYDEETFAITDVTGLCNFWSVFFPYPPINNRRLVADLVSSVTGLNIEEGDLTRIANRVINLVRAYNIREGMTRKDDSVPKMFFHRDPKKPWERLKSESYNDHLDRYYELRGWNREGIPKIDTLKTLDLGFVAAELEKAGKYNEG